MKPAKPGGSDGYRTKGEASFGKEDGPKSSLGRLRLLLALDALLVHGSVGKAAEQMGIGAPAMSRLLQQIRATYKDRILVKTARGMMPTPFAETLRMRLRALAAEADDLLDVPIASDPRSFSAQSYKMPILPAPPLAMQADLSIGGPTPADLAAKLARIGPRADPHQRLAKFLATIGAGAGRSRPLLMDEANEAFALILAGQADPIQIGAFLAMLTYRGVTAAELAGLVQASRRHVSASDLNSGLVDLDWPAFPSPKVRSEPWFMLAAKLVAQAGYRVLIHGSAGPSLDGERLTESAHLLQIPVADTLDNAAEIVGAYGLAFLPLASTTSQIPALLGLYHLFEMRSSLNLAVHLLNPLGATSSVLGASHAIYETGHRDAAALLGWRDLTVFSTHRDVAEAQPFRTTKLHRLIDGKDGSTLIPAQPAPEPVCPTRLSSLEYCRAVWQGSAPDTGPQQIVIETAALAMLTLERGTAANLATMREKADVLWKSRLI